VTFCCNGIGISSTRSIAIGEAFLLQQGNIQVEPGWVGHDNIDTEISRFRDAVNLARHDLEDLRDRLPDNTAGDIVEFINTHLLMMQDHALTASVEEHIHREACTAEWGLKMQRDTLQKVFDEMEDPYLRTRKDDLDHVVNLVLKRLLNIENDIPADSTHRLDGRIVIAHDLTPSDTIILRQQGIAAFITEAGSAMSHTAILSRSMGIPTIVGAHNATRLFRNGETVVIDSLNGIATASPEDNLLQQFRIISVREEDHNSGLRSLLGKPCLSLDGEAFNLLANIEMREDIAAARDNGAVAVGLYRTEFLYMNRAEPPSEEEHYAAYADIIEGLDGMPLTIRTLDLGADKTTDFDLPTCANPALGLRAIRLCLREPNLFTTQLRAIIRASALGPVRLMIPMLTNTHEVDQSLRIIRNIQQEMRVEGVTFDRQMPIGGMIEVPAAALAANAFASRLDFLSIGTNDLIQYTLAVDRLDDETSHLYDPLHPAVISLIANIMNAGRRYGKAVSMCGEMAGDTRYMPLLAGLGLRDFSMQPNSLLLARERLLSCDFESLQKRADALLKAILNNEEDSQVEQMLRILH
jgi:phosphotransferase system enzyme I (PtsI)